MEQGSAISWRNPWFRRCVISLVLFTVGSFLVGFIVLPSVHGDFTARGLWDSICQAAGAPRSWAAQDANIARSPRSTEVVLERAMARPASSAAVGRGATLALNCTMCHGAQGMSASNAPNLAGQYPEVIMKQLHDYKSGKRNNAIMQALAHGLDDSAIDDLAAYYAYLPKARTAPTTYDENLPALVRVGSPMRNIAPCISCHGGIDQKLGAPWLEGMPKDYLVEQLLGFRAGTRGNDAQGQMRTMARAMTDAEIQQVATFYARKAVSGEAQ